MLSSSPLLDLVRAGAFVMLLFAAILIWVVLRNLETPIKFGTRAGPALVGIALVLFALPIYGDVAGVESLADNGSLFRVFAGFLLPTGLYLMRPLTNKRRMYESSVDEGDPS
ncbi:MAG TPA: hypothetical protein VE174_15040 [Actinomycetota bacterium]|nr:hypothetical protein [Actinomycetota bacterium]